MLGLELAPVLVHVLELALEPEPAHNGHLLEQERALTSAEGGEV